LNTKNSSGVGQNTTYTYNYWTDYAVSRILIEFWHNWNRTELIGGYICRVFYL
jgi:hypothetical protein